MLPTMNIAVWPTSSAGKIKATAKVVFGDKFSVYPIKIIEGKDGMFLGMPQVPDRNGAYKDVFHPNTKEAREHLTEMVLAAYNPNKSMKLVFSSDMPVVFGANVSLYDSEESDLIGFARIDINDEFSMERIRMFQARNKETKSIYFPERGYLENGKTITKAIFEFENDTESFLKKIIGETYDAAFQARSEARIRKAMTSMNYSRELNLDELMELKRRKEATERHVAGHNEIPAEEPEDCVFEEELVL